MRTNNPTRIPRRIRRLLECGLPVILVLSAVACRGSSTPESELDIDLSVSPTPPAVGPARLTIRITDREGRTIDRALVIVQGTMSHAGMTPTSVEAEPTGDGRFVVEEFDFSMGGDWILSVSVGLPDRRSGQRDFPLRVVGSPDDQGGP